MKKISFFALALAAGLMMGCSDDNSLVEGPSTGSSTTGKGYISLAINLPTQPSARANDKYDDGTPEEYDVKDATLILFADDKINSAYSLTLNFSPEGTTDNITTTAKITQQINSIDSKDIEALVVLNNNGMFTVDNSDLKVNETSMKGKSLDELNEAVNAQIGNKTWTEIGFLMSNAVLATAPGGVENPATAQTVTLVPIAANKIYSTSNEASLNPAASIYVERAVSKVTLIASDGKTTDGTQFNYTIDGWTLDNTNNSSKLVRTADNFSTWKSYFSNAATLTDKYRFVGSVAVGKNIDASETYYRVYWGEDYNYDTALANSFTTVGGQTVADASLNKNVDGTVARYCFENTSNLAEMLEENMTRVIVKATFNNGADFYLVDNDKNKLWTLEQVQQEVAARLIKEPTFNAWAQQNLKDNTTKLTESDFTVTLSASAGDCTVTDITLTEAGQAKFKAGVSLQDNVETLANGEITISKYANGESYYSVWVNHFGQDSTPWDTNETNAPEAGNIYPGGEKNYLGRWGMLRNNWYEINVKSIKGIGDPTVAEVTGETIDKKDSYIAVQINILSWAKRTQNADL